MFLLLRYTLKSALARRLTAFATILGMAALVFTLTGSFMLLDGVNRALRDQGSPTVGVVLATGAEAETGSLITATSVPTILDVAGVPANSADVVTETITVITVPRPGGGLANTLVRGITEKGIAFRKNVRIVEGRAPTPGTNESMVGVKLRGRVVDGSVGGTLRVNKKLDLKVVGYFSDDGSAYESELWCDRDALSRAIGKEDFVSSIRIRLSTDTELRNVKTALQRENKRVKVSIVSERDYFENQGAIVAPLVIALGLGMSFFIGLGASLGVAMTMFGAVAQRTREVGVLRALGFGRTHILTAFLGEAAAYGVLGGVLGSLAALALTTMSFGMMGSSWSEISFSFRAGPMPMIIATAVATTIGLVSGLLPALRASRISPIAAMRT